MSRCKCGRATLQDQCGKCRITAVVHEQDKRNTQISDRRKAGKIQDSLLFAGIHIDT